MSSPRFIVVDSLPAGHDFLLIEMDSGEYVIAVRHGAPSGLMEAKMAMRHLHAMAAHQPLAS